MVLTYTHYVLFTYRINFLRIREFNIEKENNQHLAFLYKDKFQGYIIHQILLYLKTHLCFKIQSF